MLCCLLIHQGKEEDAVKYLAPFEPADPVIIGSLLTTQRATPLEGVFTFLLSVIPTSHSSTDSLGQ